MRTFLLVALAACILAISLATKEKSVKKRAQYPFFSNHRDAQNSQDLIFASVEDNADAVEAAWNDAQAKCGSMHGRTQIACISDVVAQDIDGVVENPYAVEYVQGAIEGLMAPCGNAESKRAMKLKNMPKDVNVMRKWVKEGFKKAKRQGSSSTAEGFQNGLLEFKAKCASYLVEVYSSSASGSSSGQGSDQTTEAASYVLAKQDPGHEYLNCVWKSATHGLFPMKSFQLLSNYVSGFLAAYNGNCYAGSSWETVVGP